MIGWGRGHALKADLELGGFFEGGRPGLFADVRLGVPVDRGLFGFNIGAGLTWKQLSD